MRLTGALCRTGMADLDVDCIRTSRSLKGLGKGGKKRANKPLNDKLYRHQSTI